ncbi:hypothetical protein KL866_11825 [Alteromonas sp. ALT199]|uniref:hypothetical protein n=1 Tax=unclassified Alteromonas TaxID=2614992 RepID=UPI0012DBCCE4|nr:hypothetical protein [Alteromonas sp. ALT199]MBT3135785.1 hypothetical protein [Alteromonas sp. ALT199]
MKKSSPWFVSFAFNQANSFKRKSYTGRHKLTFTNHTVDHPVSKSLKHIDYIFIADISIL